MKYLIFEPLYQKLAIDCYESGCAIDVIWIAVGSLRPHANRSEREFPENVEENYPLRVELFLHIVRILLEDGRLKLADFPDGELSTLSVDEQLIRFAESFPESEKAFIDKHDTLEDGDDFGLWFWMGDCPYGGVWVYHGDEGNEILDWTW